MNKNIKKNYVFNVIYQISLIMVYVVLTPYLTRTLGSNGMGKYSYYYSWAGYFALFSMLGNSLYGNRSVAQVSGDRNERTRLFWQIYFVQLLSSCVVFICYCFYAFIFHRDNVLAWIFGLYVLSFVFEISWFFWGMEEFKLPILRDSFIKIITIIFTVLLVKTEKDVWIYAMIISCGTLLTNVCLFLQLPKYINLKNRCMSDFKKHIQRSLVFFVPVLSISLYKIMDKVMLGIMSSFEEVGYYESCERIINVPLVFTTALGTVMLPRISNMVMQNEGEREKGEKYLRRSLHFVMGISSATCFGIIGVADAFVPLFFGNGFEKCIDLLSVLILSCLFLVFAQTLKTQYLIPYGLEKHFTISTILGAIANLVINAALIPQFASIGAAIGSVCAEAVVCAYQCVYLRKYLPIKRYIAEVLPFCVIGLVMCICVRGYKGVFVESPIMLLGIKIFIGICIYFFGLVVIIGIARLLEKHIRRCSE